jgi:hypothetical protein
LGATRFSRAHFDEIATTRLAVVAKTLNQLARTLAFRLRRTDGELRAWYEA